MSERPVLNRTLDAAAFLSYYYLKEELVEFCRQNGLPVSGGKIEITNRIARFLDTGETDRPGPGKTGRPDPVSRKKPDIGVITKDMTIEPDFVCSEKHRAFFRENIGKSFSFYVPFQKWLKNNTGKTYQEAIEAWYRIARERKSNKTTIDRQFEYNTYIRDFFADNKGRSLEEAISCWKYKKGLPGSNLYEKTDLTALD